MVDHTGIPHGDGGVDPLEMIGSLARLTNPTEAFQEVLRLTTKWFGADCGQIIVTDVESGESEVKAVSSAIDPDDLNFSRTILADVLAKDQPICVPDAKQHASFRKASSVAGSGRERLSVIVVPLHDASGRPQGALYLQRYGGERGCFDSTTDLGMLSQLTDRLTPILFAQQQKRLFETLRLDHTKIAIAEMGFIVGQSPRMDEEVYDLIDKYAQSDMTILIEGDTGTGKELVAEAIHKLGRRAGKPFVRVSCNAIPVGLAESEFYGHVKGSFAQAYRDKPGKFELAEGGTLFLDEIGKLSLELQGKLLHVLERGSTRKVRFTRVGGTKEISADVRTIAATNQDLRKLVATGEYRQDLYFRLNHLPIRVPPLHERQEDIIPLAQGFLDLAAEGQRPALRLTDEAKEVLLAYGWPGNVREMKSAMERAALMHEGSDPLTAKEVLGDRSLDVRCSNATGRDLFKIPFRDLSRREKREVVRAAVVKYGGVSQAARELRISRQTVYNNFGAAGEPQD